jgi:choline dehydrogenase
MGRFISSAGLLVVVAATAIATATTNKPLPDYVIVGAGPAGMVLAEHLSRDAKVHVVLIEAGPDSINSTSVNSESSTTRMHRFWGVEG